MPSPDPSPVGVPPEDPPPHPQPARPQRLLPASPEGWLVFVAGLALVGYGLWRVLHYGGSIFGLIFMAIGATLMPYRFVGLAGGVALLGIGIYCIVQGSSLLGVIASVFGLLSIAERWRRTPAWFTQPRRTRPVRAPRRIRAPIIRHDD